MRITMKFALSFAAAAAFSALPVYAQHGGGHGGGPPAGVGASMGSAHSSSSSSTHGNSSKDGSANSNSTGHSSSGPKTPGQLLTQNTRLSSKLQGLLPAGTDLQMAANGFKNLGQFVAAVHVSHNLGIPFDQLKAKMIGPPSESLGKAIQGLKPAANSKEESKKGEQQAKQDMNDSKKS